jgi:fucose permease
LLTGGGRAECLERIEQAPGDAEVAAHAAEATQSGESAFRRVMRLRAVHFFAFYILIYVGVEVTLGGMSCCRCRAKTQRR